MKNTPNHRGDPMKNSKIFLFQKSKCTHVSSINLKGKVSHSKNIVTAVVYFWEFPCGSPCMCDFPNFGLIFVGQMHCLPQRLKSTLFEIFSNGGCPKGTRSVEKISNNVDFSLWGNRATTWEYFLTFSSETKIMKIRHSVTPAHL